MQEKNTSAIKNDLERFIEKFKPNKYKHINRGIDIRGIHNLHRDIGQAKAIIAELKLKLEVFHHAEMITYNGFEVNCIK